MMRKCHTISRFPVRRVETLICCECSAENERDLMHMPSKERKICANSSEKYAHLFQCIMLMILMLCFTCLKTEM